MYQPTSPPPPMPEGPVSPYVPTFLPPDPNLWDWFSSLPWESLLIYGWVIPLWSLSMLLVCRWLWRHSRPPITYVSGLKSDLLRLSETSPDSETAMLASALLSRLFPEILKREEKTPCKPDNGGVGYG